MNDAPVPKNLAAELAGVRRQVALAFLFCAAAFAVAIWWLPQQLEFPTDLGARLAFAVRACLLVIFWVLVGVHIVATLRRHSTKDIAGSAYGPPSERLRVPLAFLQNTLEQATITVVTMLALATVEGEAPLAFIMASVALFAIGRITFLRGYSDGSAARAFGIATTVFPIHGAFWWVVYDTVASLLRGGI